MTDLNEQGALDLLDQVSKETDLVKQLEMRKALDAYQTKRNDSGLPAFSTPEDQRIENRKRHEAFYAAGLSGIDKVLPEGDREIFNQTIADSVDPENTKAEAVNKLYVGQTRPELVPLLKDNWEGVKSGFAKSQFGWGGGPISDTAFYSMAAGKFKEQADERTMISDVFADIQLAAAKGDSFLETWKKSSNAAMANPSWKIENHDKYRELAQKIYDETVTETGPLRPAIELGKAYYGKAAAGEFDKSAYDAFVGELVGLEPDQRKLALSLAISVGVDRAPRTRDAGGSAGFMETAAVRMERATGAFIVNILRLRAQEAATYAKEQPGADLAKLDEQKTRLDVMRKVDEGLTGAVDPATSSNAFVKGVYDAIDSGPYMLASMSIYGLPLVLASMAEDNRAQLMERGVPAKEAESLAWIAAAPQTIIERLKATMLLGKIPGFDKWLSKTVTTKTGFVTKMLGVTGIEIAQQNTEELLQAFMPPLAQEIASWFSEVYPDVKWTGTGGELDQIATGTVDTFFATLPLVLIGTGSASFKEGSYGLKYLQDIKVLRAGGFTERAAAEIADLASAGDLAGAAQLAQEGWTDPNKRPRSKLEALNAEVAAQVAEMDQANLEADAAAMDALDADMKASYEESVNPVGATAVKLEDGTWQVSDEQGNLVDITTTPESAQELVKMVDQAADLNTEESLNDLVDYFNARAEEGSTIELLGTRKSLADKVALGEITPEGAAHAVQIAIQFGQLEEGTQTTGAYLGGENEAKFNAKEQIFKDVSRIFYDGDAMTLVEEKAEGYLKRRLQDGTLDLAEIDAWREKVDGPQADKSARALTEWFSKWAQGYIVGNQDNALIPSSFRAFLLKMKKYMDEILGFAARYAELDAAGKLPDGFKTHLARAVGLDQNWVARQARTEANSATDTTFALKTIVAPVRSDQLKGMKRSEMNKRAGSAKFIHLQQITDDIAQAYGVKIISRQPIVGGWVENGVASLEVPEVVEFDTNDLDLAEEMAALIAASAPELQNGALVWRDDVAGDSTVVEFQAKSADKALLIANELNEAGVQGFSYDVSTRMFSIILTGTEAKDHPKLNEYLDEKTQQGYLGARGNVTSRAGSARFPAETEYRKHIQGARDRAVGLGAKQASALGEVISRAERRVDRYVAALNISKKANRVLKKTKAPVTSASAIEAELAGKQFADIRELALWLDERFTRLIGKPSYKIGSEEGIKSAGQALAYDILDGLSKDGSGMGWYDERVQETILELMKLHPEFSSDPGTLAVYIGILATTSQGYTVTENFKQADIVYQAYKKTGKLPTNLKFAQGNDPINGNLAQIQGIIDKHGIDGFVAFMDQEITGGALKAMGYEPVGVTLDDTVRGARILGPKIGSFFNNLRGNFDTITMDLWYTRSMHRYIGETVEPLESERMQELLRAFREELQKPGARTYGIDIAEALASDEATLRAGRTLFQRWGRGKNEYAEKGYTKFDDGYEVEKAARNIMSDGSMKAAPQNKTYRLYFEEIVKEAKNILADQGLKLTEADMQAIVWYREKNLFARSGVANAASKPADYLDAVMVSRNKAAGVTFSLTQTNTPAFKRWFRDSKAVNKDGTPMPLYHGTPQATFSEFKTDGGYEFGPAAYFTPDPNRAVRYSGMSRAEDMANTPGATVSDIEGEMVKNANPAVYQVYASIQNPISAAEFDGLPGVTNDEKNAEARRRGYDGVIKTWPANKFRGEIIIEVAVFKDTQVKSATGNNGKWDGNNPDITFSLTNIKKTSANDLADTQGVPRTIPQKYKGKKILPIMADLLGAGTVDGIPIEGGPAHPILYAGTGVAWRSNRGAITGILGMLKSRGAIWVDENGKRKALVSVFAMSQDAHQSNKNTFLSFIKAIEDSNVSDAAKIRLGKYVRGKAKNKAFASDRLAKFPLSWDTAKLDAYAADFTFAERSSLMTMLRQAGAQEIGTPDAETIVRQLRDDSYDKVSSGSMLNIIEVDVDRLEKGLKDDTLNASDFGVPEHVSYDTVLPGDIVTHLRQPVAMEVAFKGMVKQMSEASPKSRPDYLMQAKLPASVQLETLTDERIAEINAEQSGQTSVAKAKAYIAALSDRWDTVNAKSTKGVADFVSAIKRNLFSETLTKMDRSEVTKMAKEGKIEVFGLEGFDVWFGLITKEDGTKELVSVVSNEHSTGGMLDLVMMKSIDEGATRLDCYAVKNSKMPNGLLPTLYGKHGWRVTETLPYNKKYLGDTDAARDKKEKALMTQWESQGWDRTLHGMPDVVVMEHGQALSNARELQGDARGGMAEGAVVEAGAESAESTVGDATDGRSRSDGGQSSRDAGGGGERYSRKVRDFIAELETATGNRLKAWGITPEQRDQIVASSQEKKSGITFSVEEQQALKHELTGIPQTTQQAIQAQAERIRAKRLNATAQLIAQIKANTSLSKSSKMVRKTTEASLLARAAVPITGRLMRIAKPLAQRLRRFEYDLGIAIKNDYEKLHPFMVGFETMSQDDAKVLDLTLKNGDIENRDALLAKYNLTEAYANVTEVLADLRQRAIDAGYEVGEIQNYFPRKVKDLDGLFAHYYGTEIGGSIDAALKVAEDAAHKAGRKFGEDERAEVTNRVLQGNLKKSSKPGNIKTRKTDVVGVAANEYYQDSIQALMSYVDSMNQAIEKRRFFGKYAVAMSNTEGVTALSNKLALDASIGAMVSDMVANGQLDRAKQAEVVSIFEGRFNQGVATQFIRNAKALSYMTTMGQFTSALTQLGDLAVSLYENGVFNTMVAGAQAFARKSKITRQALGIDNIAEEFREASKLHRALNFVFKATGLHYIDMVGKETLVNAKFRKIQQEVNQGNISDKTRNLIINSFGPDGAAQVMKDFGAGNQTADTMFAVYSVLADYQPLNLSEYPEAYLRHPNGRIFYMLKTFTLKQIDAFRREGIDQIVKGNAKQKAQGMKNLIHLMGLFYIIGVPVDWLKDWLMGRDPRLSDLAVDNLFKLMGVSRWHVWNFRTRGNPLESAMMLVLPPAPFLTYPFMDMQDAAKQIEKGDEIIPANFNTWRILPWVGSPYYWHLGGGAEKIEKRRQKRENE